MQELGIAVKQLDSRLAKILKELSILESINKDLFSLQNDKLDENQRIATMHNFSWMLAKALRPCQSLLCRQFLDFPWLQLEEIAKFSRDEIAHILRQPDANDYIARIHQQLTAIIGTARAEFTLGVDHLDYLDYRQLPTQNLQRLSTDLHKFIEKCLAQKLTGVENAEQQLQRESSLLEVLKSLQSLEKVIESVLEKLLKADELDLDCTIFYYLDSFNGQCENYAHHLASLEKEAEISQLIFESRQYLKDGIGLLAAFISQKGNHGCHAKLATMAKADAGQQYLAMHINSSIEFLLARLNMLRDFHSFAMPLSIRLCIKLLKLNDAEAVLIELFVAIRLQVKDIELARPNYQTEKTRLNQLLLFTVDYMTAIQELFSMQIILPKYLKVFHDIHLLNHELSKIEGNPEFKRVFQGFKDLFKAENENSQLALSLLSKEELYVRLMSLQDKQSELMSGLVKNLDVGVRKKKLSAVKARFAEFMQVVKFNKSSTELLTDDEISLAEMDIQTQLPIFSKEIKFVTNCNKLFAFIETLVDHGVEGVLKAGKVIFPESNVLTTITEAKALGLNPLMSLLMKDLIESQFKHGLYKRIKNDFVLSKKMCSDIGKVLNPDMSIGQFIAIFSARKEAAEQSAKVLMNTIPRFLSNVFDEEKNSSELKDVLADMSTCFSESEVIFEKIARYLKQQQVLQQGFSSSLNAIVLSRNIACATKALAVNAPKGCYPTVKKMMQLRCLQIVGECMANIRRFGDHLDLHACDIRFAEIYQITRLRNLLYHTGMDTRAGRRLLDQYIFEIEFAPEENGLNEFVVRVNWFNQYIGNYCQDNTLAKEFAYTYVGGLAGLLYKQLENDRRQAGLKQFFRSVLIYKADGNTTSLLTNLYECKYDRNQLAHHLLDGTYDNYRMITDVLSPLLHVVWAILELRPHQNDFKAMREHIEVEIDHFCYMLELSSVKPLEVLQHLNKMMQKIQGSEVYSLYPSIYREEKKLIHAELCNGFGLFGDYLLHCRNAGENRAATLISVKL